MVVPDLIGGPGYELVPLAGHSEHIKRLIIKLERPIGGDLYLRRYETLQGSKLNPTVHELAPDTKLGAVPNAVQDVVIGYGRRFRRAGQCAPDQLFQRCLWRNERGDHRRLRLHPMPGPSGMWITDPGGFVICCGRWVRISQVTSVCSSALEHMARKPGKFAGNLCARGDLNPRLRSQCQVEGEGVASLLDLLEPAVGDPPPGAVTGSPWLRRGSGIDGPRVGFVRHG